jgi:translation initiation factor 3 subunit A
MKKLDTYDTEGLISIQVAQLEKEKKSTAEKLRITAKKMDHLERAYRKSELPLLSSDYAQQQAQDLQTFKATQVETLELSKRTHKEDMQTKKRVSRMMDDYEQWKGLLAGKRGEEYKRKLDIAKAKIEQEKRKREEEATRKWEEEKERKRLAEEEERQLEEEERAKEAGRFSLTPTYHIPAFNHVSTFSSSRGGRTSPPNRRRTTRCRRSSTQKERRRNRHHSRST